MILCTSKLTMRGFELPCNEFGDSYLYWLLYNQSRVKQNFLDSMNAPLKMSIDAIRASRMVENALSNFILKENSISGPEGPEIEHKYTYQDFPKVQSRVFNKFDTASGQGNFWFFIPVMISFLGFNSELLTEKEKKLRIGLMLFGISSAAYWLSWIIFALIFDIFYASFMILLAKLFGFSIFVNTPFIISWLIFFSLTFSFHTISMLLVSFFFIKDCYCRRK